MRRFLGQIKDFTDTLYTKRPSIILLLLILFIYIYLMTSDIALVVIGIVGIIVTVIVVMFFNGIDKDIIEDRDKVFPKINEEIKEEFAKYEASSESGKKKIINTIKELDTFRLRLRGTRRIRNRGFFLLFIELIVLAVFLVLLSSFPISILLARNVNIPSTIFLFIGEALLLIPFLIWTNFDVLWKVSHVLIEHIDNKNEDLTIIVCKIFKTDKKR